MEYPVLYRKRIIPDECILLKDDVIVSYDEDIIITKWNALHPKPDLHHGQSVFVLKEGFKISKFCREDNSLLYWYCDIVTPEYKKASNELIVTDLLVDVIIYPDGLIKVVDVDELVEALNKNLITTELLKDSLLKLDNLLKLIYSGDIEKYKNLLSEK